MVEYLKDDFTSNIMDGFIFDDNSRLRNGLIFHKYRIHIIHDSKLKEKLISALHDASFMGNI